MENKWVVDDVKWNIGDAIKMQQDMSQQYEAVSEICGNITEIIKIHLFKENGQKENAMLALREKSLNYTQNDQQKEIDDY